MSYENSYNSSNKGCKPAELIEDYLELIRCSQPYCNCGKCITQKYSHNPQSYQYEKNLKSSYKKEFNWKQPEDKMQVMNRRKPLIQNLGIDNGIKKEHLKSSLISVMKNDYCNKNLKEKEDLVLNNFNKNQNQNQKITKNNNDSLNLTIKNNNNNNNNVDFNVKRNANSCSIMNKVVLDTQQQGKNENNYTKINKYSNNIKNFNTNTNTFNNNSNDNVHLNSNTNKDIKITNDGSSISTTNLNILNNCNIKKNLNDSSSINKNNNNIAQGNHSNYNTLLAANNNKSKNKNSNSNSNNNINNLEANSNNTSLKSPFIGRSSYEQMYPDWHSQKVIKEKVLSKVLESVPFNGRSSYQNDFHQHEMRYYVDRAAPIIKLDNLESSGKLVNETTTNQSYKPIDYTNFNQLNRQEVNVSKRPSSIVPAPYSKDSFLSSYEKAFMYNNLRNKSNMRGVNRSVIY